MKTENVVVDKSRDFAIRIIRLYQYLTTKKKEYVLSKQILRSGTSIGANIKEAIRGQSRDDFAHKLNISLKEASETEYWLDLLVSTDYITQKEFDSLNQDCVELIKLLTSILKSTRKEEHKEQFIIHN